MPQPSDYKLVFMGTPAFALPALEALLEEGYAVAAVYSQPPRPAGRGQKLTPGPVHAFAESRGIEVRTPVTLKDAETQAAFRALDADLAVVAAYGLLLPLPILESTKHGCVNLHPSLLPRWRGAAPLQRTILTGDQETGVCLMAMEQGMDTGAVYACERSAVGERETFGQLHDRLAKQGAQMLRKHLPAILDGTLLPIPQSAEGVLHAPKIRKEEGRIDWSKSALELDCLVRGMNPAPGAFFLHGEETIKVWEAMPEPAPTSAMPGTVLDDRLLIACGNGTALRLLILQRPGKKALPAREFLQGCALSPSARLT
ncbi:MAG: methionyl-tRNA formyltransferase [Alphaproteobacteria bacterium]|nr:methionyl-tRNA formyltransferase [Alphaproteobacteria bacterium]